MHGMIAVFNEYQVLVSGEDIRYKMGQKVKNGGTISVAPISYRNVRFQFDGREVRTIELDPDRAPFVRMAFELYATGNYGFHNLRAALTDAGLRTKGTRRYGPRPISLHSLGNLLRDRYYLGYVTHDGIEYDGRHEPLITSDLFDRVQRVLDVERGGGTRERVNDHYLKGTLWCARCGRRLILRPSTGKSGHRSILHLPRQPSPRLRPTRPARRQGRTRRHRPLQPRRHPHRPADTDRNPRRRSRRRRPQRHHPTPQEPARPTLRPRPGRRPLPRPHRRPRLAPRQDQSPAAERP